MRKPKGNPNKGKDLGLIIAIGKPKMKKDADGDYDGDTEEDLDHRNMACVPINSLEEDGVAPEPGDEVDFTVGGKVEHVEHGNAYITIEKVNGQDVSTADKEEKEGPEEGEEEGNEEDEEGEKGFNQLREAARRRDMSRGFNG